VAGASLGVLTLAYFGSRIQVSYRTPLTGCARDAGTGGTAGVYRWAGRIGIPVLFLEVPIWEAGDSFAQREGNCVVTMGDDPGLPTGDELAPAEWMTTAEWLRRGNTMIIVTTAPGRLPRVVRQALFPWEPGEAADKAPNFLGRPSVDNRATTTGAAVTGGGVLTVESDGPRWTSPKATEPSSAGKVALPPDREKDPARWQLAGDARGGVLFRVPVGRGAVYILLDDFAWTNAGLDQGDNARALSDVLGHAVRGGTLAFDEYRHGHGRAESFLIYLLNLPGAPAVLWLATVWALLYAYGRNVRLGPVEPYVESERRTAQEYIDAVAQLYERARAAPLVVEAVARRLRQVARNPADPPPEVVSAIRTADAYAGGAQRPASADAPIRLVRHLIQLRKGNYGSRTIS
jgi:hypothetical protein